MKYLAILENYKIIIGLNFQLGAFRIDELLG